MSKQDPTGQARNRNRSTRSLTRRLDIAEKTIKRLFRDIPKTSRRQTKIQNAKQETIYEYGVNPQDLEQLSRSISFTLNEQLLETQTDSVPFNWYWKAQVELPYRQGAIEETRDYTQEIAIAAGLGFFAKRIKPGVPAVEQVLLSEPYRASLNAVYVDNFNTIKGLSDDTSKQVYRVINNGINSGAKPSVIAADISRRFSVSRSSAKRIADTETNKAYNDARLGATKLLSAQTGLRSGVVHISALLPNGRTRQHHADRHGNSYTVEDQRQWWDTGANRINCHCSTRSVLIDGNGNVVNVELQEDLKEEKKFFD